MATGRQVDVPTRDPFDGGRLVVTRLENPATGTAFEGRFGFGWLGELTTDQLDFVGLLLARRNNVQRLASDLGIAYNTARNRLEDIVTALGAAAEDDLAESPAPAGDVRSVLERLAAGEITQDEADALLGPA